MIWFRKFVKKTTIIPYAKRMSTSRKKATNPLSTSASVRHTISIPQPLDEWVKSAAGEVAKHRGRRANISEFISDLIAARRREVAA